jgi:hypothetical protein
MKIYKLITTLSFPVLLITTLTLKSQGIYSEVYFLPFQSQHLVNQDIFFICDYIHLKLAEKLSPLQKDKQIIIIPPSETIDKLSKLNLNYSPLNESELDQLASKFLTRPKTFLIFGTLSENPKEKRKNLDLFISSSTGKRKFKFNLDDFTNLNSLTDSVSSFIYIILTQRSIFKRQWFSIDLMGSFWWYPFKGGVVKTYLIPTSFSFTIYPTGFLGIRLGGFRYWSKVVQNDFSIKMRPDDPLLSVKTFYGAKIGLGLKIYFIKLTADFEQIIPPGKQPNEILPFFFVTSSAQVILFNKFSIGPTVTFFKPRELLSVNYAGTKPIYQIATYKITYFPGVALGFIF